MRLLIIGDLGGQLVAASKIATANGAKVLHVADIKSAMNALRNGKQAEIIFIDVDCDIAKLVSSLDEEKFFSTVIACGIQNDKEKAVKAIKAGAKEYLPLPPQEEMIAAILEAVASSDEELKILSKSTVFQEVMKVADQIANSEASVLITGESGTGKEVMAKYLHSKSKRKNNDLISVNCAAIPENLLESELFGHEKGAFTGAVDRRIGKFEAANGSTILLDEVSELDIKLQAKLLRVLQEKEIVRVGGNNVVKLDVRVICTTNRELNEWMKLGNFREDLFYRINVINIKLPNLHERKEDILELAKGFIVKYAKLNAVEEKQFSTTAINKLLDYKWPGNIRELENTVHRALLLSAGSNIEESDIYISASSTVSNDNEASSRTLEEIESEAINNTIKKYNGDEVKAAMVLGISIKTLKARLKKYDIANS